MLSSQSQASSQTSIGLKRLLLLASALVFIIGFPLYLFPGHTDILFSWTVNPPLTAAFLGAAYLSSCILEFLSARESTWARARVGIPAVLLFTALTLVATLMHIGNISMQLERPLQWNPDKEEFLDNKQANALRARPMRAPWTSKK